jgi:hypothetical protein
MPAYVFSSLDKFQSVAGHCIYVLVGKVQWRPEENTAFANAGQWHANGGPSRLRRFSQRHDGEGVQDSMGTLENATLANSSSTNHLRSKGRED